MTGKWGRKQWMPPCQSVERNENGLFELKQPIHLFLLSKAAIAAGP
jgi:hypothetical protein